MPLPIEDIVKFIIENIRKSGSPIPMSKESISEWAKGLNIPRGGDTILYTGLLYQLQPYLDATVRYLETLEESRVGGTILKLGRLAGKIIDLSRIISNISKEDVDRQNKIIRSIALLLRKIGIKYGYLYDDEMYSGVLLYDMGLVDEFKEHAYKVYDLIKRYGVKKLITIDPHTTYVMKEVYNEYIPGYNVKVVNYLELLNKSDLKPVKKLDDEVVIHDSCYYARYLDIIDEPRQLLNNSGINVIEPRLRSGKYTFCCGGPIEALSPKMARKIAEIRFRELRRYGRKIVVMCPICYENLSRVSKDVEINDISHYLSKAYLT